jgi:excisionase family DNA binding protein
MRHTNQTQPQTLARAAHSIAETCALTGLSRETLYGAIRAGKLIARKLGRRTIITHGDMTRFLDALPIGLDAEPPRLRNSRRKVPRAGKAA